MTTRNPFCVLLFVVLCNTTNYKDNKKCKLPCTNYRDHKNFYYKKTTQQIPANRKFPIHSNTNTFCPFRCYTQQKQQKNPIVPNQKLHTSHSSTSLQTILHNANCQHTISHSYIFHITPSVYKGFFNFADNTPFFTTK